jgi:hypothetical protein
MCFLIHQNMHTNFQQRELGTKSSQLNYENNEPHIIHRNIEQYIRHYHLTAHMEK